MAGYPNLLTAQTLRWCGQRAFQRPTLMQALIDQSGVPTKAQSPIGLGQRDAVPFQKLVASSVSRLRGSGCPSAVFWRVRAVVIDAIQLMAWWALAHVTNKRSEILSPRFADGNTSTAVVFIGRQGRAIAPSLHVPPPSVGRVAAKTMPSISLNGQLARTASTTRRVTGAERRNSYGFYLTAVAPTLPMRTAERADRYPATESHACADGHLNTEHFAMRVAV